MWSVGASFARGGAARESLLPLKRGRGRLLFQPPEGRGKELRSVSHPRGFFTT
jgi:hypothetical protein